MGVKKNYIETLSKDYYFIIHNTIHKTIYNINNFIEIVNMRYVSITHIMEFFLTYSVFRF